MAGPAEERNNINAGEPESVSPYREALLEAEKSHIRRCVTERIMAHDTDTDPTNH